MSILDRAKKQLENRFKGVGEETIRVMDAVNEEPQSRQRKEKPAPQPKPVRKKEEKEKSDLFSFKNKILSRPKPEEDIREERVKPTPKPAPKPKPEKDTASDAFAIEDDAESEYFENMDKKFNKKMKQYEQVPVPIIDEGKLQDILELLQIPVTYEIESDIFLPEDLNDIAFDIQVPQGYEIGEVDTFVSRVKITVAKLVELLNARNEHVAKLATVVDRLQVDISNIRLQTEVANGINIMPTNDTEYIEQENYELKSLVKRLEEQIETETGIDDKLSSDERETFEQLQDEVSLNERRIRELEEEAYTLRTQLALKEEEEDDEGESAFPQETDTYENSQANNDEIELPDMTDIGLPDLGEVSSTSYSDSSYNEPSDYAFADEEESLDEFLLRNQSYYEKEDTDDTDEESFISVLDDNGTAYGAPKMGTFYEEDDDNEFEKLQEWSNKQ